ADRTECDRSASNIFHSLQIRQGACESGWWGSRYLCLVSNFWGMEGWLAAGRVCILHSGKMCKLRLLTKPGAPFKMRKSFLAILLCQFYIAHSQNTIGIPTIINHSKEEYRAGN